MSANIPTFLRNWDPILADDFRGKWWVNNAEHGGNPEGYDGLWPEHTSPFDSHELQEIDEREEELLRMLEDGMLELEELDNEINHSWGRATEIQELLGFQETASQP
ncbi:hypothetical protein PAXINDRAFT_19883 [Paxillus involutus ATCC 200175]|uniref:Uncharacterized protein n=1 Tax=Paxillus involutus ATCC 200175 TaxID=664439 RepID=A0A0C9SW02_PAXIN|nr:hypothetical protein PAXINDRAFT_19883 [Paxillus involutus ATCC 200175]